MKAVFIGLFSLISAAQVFSQAISGLVADAKTGEPIIGANVVIQGTQTGASTGLLGEFTIKSSGPGQFTLLVTSVGYKGKVIPGVSVSMGEQVELNILLEEDIAELSGVVVSAMKQSDSDLDLLNYMKAGELVVSGVSREQIAKSEDRDAAQAVRRAPGVTLMDNRFVVVRGLNSRYNTVLLNGIIAPSSEPDSRAFSFDIVPSSMLDRILVYKSGAAELPGEFAGSVIDISIRDAMEEDFTTISLSAGYRHRTTFNEFQSQQSKSADWIAFGDKNRRLPAGAPGDYRDLGFDYDRIVAESRKFENDWALRTISPAPDLRARLEFGRTFYIGKLKASAINSFSYSNTNKGSEQHRNRYYNYKDDGSSVTEFDFNDRIIANSVRLGGLSSWMFQLNPANRIKFNGLYSRLGTSETTVRNGADYFKDQDVLNYSMRYMARTISMGQLTGIHELNEHSKLSWMAGVSSSVRNEPGWKRISLRRNMGTENPFQVNIPNNANASDASIFSQDLNEIGFSHSVHFERSLNAVSGLKPVKLKTGYFGEYKARDFSARTIGWIKFGNQFDPQIAAQPYDLIFNSENIKAPDGIVVSENTKYTDVYRGGSFLVAAYAGGSMPLPSKLAATAGFRVEYSQIDVKTGISPVGRPDEIHHDKLSLLPSVALNCEFAERSKLRFAYSKSVNRPEFRELAPFSFYDFSFEVDILGNPGLNTADIHNFDLRWELYPSPLELVSAGIFFKDFRNPIEAEIREGTSKPVFIFNNAKEAIAYGAEIELRKNLDGFFGTDFLKNLSFLFNGAYIVSEIDLGGPQSSVEARVRPMQGQSPYVINAGLFYQNEETGLQASALYNVSGTRIFSVGSGEYPTIYEMPRHLVDLSISQEVKERMSFSAGISDLFNSRAIYREDGDRNARINSSITDKQIFNAMPGRNINVGFAYKF